MELKVLFAILASIFQIAAFFSYLRSSFFKSTRPHVVTWLIWLLTNSIAVAGLWVGGGGIGAVAPTISAVLVAAVFVGALRFGKRDIAKADIPIFILALSAIFVWWIFDNPVLAVLIVSAVDIIGYVPTFRKSYIDPSSENAFSWALFALAPICAILALNTYSVLTLSYLLPIATVNSALSILIIVRKTQ